MKAYQLIDRRSKWYGARGYTDGQHCALTAIICVYAHDPAIRRSMEDRLREAIGGQITTWNDSHDWSTVYETLKRLDI